MARDGVAHRTLSPRRHRPARRCAGPSSPAAPLERLAAFAQEWKGMVANEQQLAQLIPLQRRAALGMAPPRAAGTEGSDFGFERRLVAWGGRRIRIDLHQRWAGHEVMG